MTPIPPLRSNLAHLHSHDEHLLWPGMLAERYFAGDPNTSLLKPRQLAEVLGQLAASIAGLFGGPEESQFDLLSRLRDHAVTPSEAHQLFSEIPRTGNTASHALPDDHRTALAIHFNEDEIRLLIDEQLRQPGWLPDSQKMPLHTRGSPREGQTQGHCRVAHRHRAGGLRAFCRANPNGAGQGEAEELRCRRLPEPGQALRLRIPPLRRNPASRSEMGRERRIPPPFAFSTSGLPHLRQLATQLALGTLPRPHRGGPVAGARPVCCQTSSQETPPQRICRSRSRDSRRHAAGCIHRRTPPDAPRGRGRVDHRPFRLGEILDCKSDVPSAPILNSHHPDKHRTHQNIKAPQPRSRYCQRRDPRHMKTLYL